MMKHLRISGNYAFQEYEVNADLSVLSLGAGVQSTRVLLGILEGEYDPAPTCAIFADTQWEPAAVYRHLEWLISEADKATFPVHIVTAGNIRSDTMQAATERKDGTTGRFASIPVWTRNQTGEQMMMRRQCTREYKIEPVQRKIRELLGLKKGDRAAGRFNVETWQGISYDEIGRMKESAQRWEWRRYPLIERRETRADCLSWLRERGYPEPPKSACTGCPYHDNAYWRALQESSPEDWADAVDFDRQLNQGNILGWDRPAYLHRDLIPLDQVNLTNPEESQMSLFGEECEGICGV